METSETELLLVKYSGIKICFCCKVTFLPHHQSLSTLSFCLLLTHTNNSYHLSPQHNAFASTEVQETFQDARLQHRIFWLSSLSYSLKCSRKTERCNIIREQETAEQSHVGRKQQGATPGSQVGVLYQEVLVQYGPRKKSTWTLCSRELVMGTNTPTRKRNTPKRKLGSSRWSHSPSAAGNCPSCAVWHWISSEGTAHCADAIHFAHFGPYQIFFNENNSIFHFYCQIEGCLHESSLLQP